MHFLFYFVIKPMYGILSAMALNMIKERTVFQIRSFAFSVEKTVFYLSSLSASARPISTNVCICAML